MCLPVGGLITNKSRSQHKKAYFIKKMPCNIGHENAEYGLFSVCSMLISSAEHAAIHKIETCITVTNDYRDLTGEIHLVFAINRPCYHLHEVK